VTVTNEVKAVREETLCFDQLQGSMSACLLCRKGGGAGDSDSDSDSDDDESSLFGRLTPYQCVARRAEPSSSASSAPHAAATPPCCRCHLPPAVPSGAASARR